MHLMSSRLEKGHDSKLGVQSSTANRAKRLFLVNILGSKVSPVVQSSSPVQWSSPVNKYTLIIHLCLSIGEGLQGVYTIKIFAMQKEWGGGRGGAKAGEMFL
jgi:hypothetical protein